ncbi:MAG TPA: ComEC/Rec2 family competence protein [Ktedonobacteraceae bacterium]|nr:ComEC/Rec2 family competence protein [Ktedonobacteraceae bacterium]
MFQLPLTPTSRFNGLFLVALTAAWVAGILCAALLYIPAIRLLLISSLLLFLIIFTWKKLRTRQILLLLLFFSVGMWRFTITVPTENPNALAHIPPGRSVEVAGEIDAEPKIEGSSRVLLVTINQISLNNGIRWWPASGQLEVRSRGTLIEHPYDPNYGDSVQVTGKLQPPAAGGSPEVTAGMAFPRISVVTQGGNTPVALLYHLRVQLATLLTQLLPQPEAALMIALFLSLRTPALGTLIPLFNLTGTAHLIAPSGFKVTILAGLVAASMRRFLPGSKEQTRNLLPAQKKRLARWQWLNLLLTTSIIAAYTLLSGGGAAALRAGIMGTLLILAPRFGRTYNVYTAMAMAALLMSLADPYVLWDAGFQLSLLGTLGIVLLTPTILRRMHFLTHLPFGHTLAEITAVTFAAQIGTLPIFAITFHEISLIAPIANTLTVPLLATTLILGLCLCITGLLNLSLGILCGWVAWPVLWYLQAIVSWCASLPGAGLKVGTISPALAWGYYILLGPGIWFVLQRQSATSQPSVQVSPAPKPAFQNWKIIQALAAILIIGATGLTTVLANPNPALTISFFDVAPPHQAPQGEAILVQTPDHRTALIDGGLDAPSLTLALNDRLPVWQHSLDMIILTNPRAEHLTGLLDTIGRYKVGWIGDMGMLHPSRTYAVWRKLIASRHIPYIRLSQGEHFSLGIDALFQIYWPQLILHKGQHELFDNSLALRLTTPTFKLLLLGTIATSTYALDQLMALPPNTLQADIIQLATIPAKAFPPELTNLLATLHPDTIVITPGALSGTQRKNNTSTQLSPTLLKPIKNEAAQIFQSAELGTLEIQASTHDWGISGSSN